MKYDRPRQKRNEENQTVCQQNDKNFIKIYEIIFDITKDRNQ